MPKLFKNTKELVQVRNEPISYVTGNRMKDLPIIKDAYLVVEESKITDFGSMDTCPDISGFDVIYASCRIVMPAWCDSHTHLVYAENREGEFVDKINGLSYEEIANRGGGILNSVKILEQTPEEAINAATVNGAYSMGLEKELGSITVGIWANLIMTKPINSFASIPYLFGSDKIEKVFLKGKESNDNAN